MKCPVRPLRSPKRIRRERHTPAPTAPHRSQPVPNPLTNRDGCSDDRGQFWCHRAEVRKRLCPEAHHYSEPLPTQLDRTHRSVTVGGVEGVVARQIYPSQFAASPPCTSKGSRRSRQRAVVRHGTGNDSESRHKRRVRRCSSRPRCAGGAPHVPSTRQWGNRPSHQPSAARTRPLWRHQHDQGDPGQRVKLMDQRWQPTNVSPITYLQVLAPARRDDGARANGAPSASCGSKP